MWTEYELVLQLHKHFNYCVYIAHKQSLFKDKSMKTLILPINRLSRLGSMYFDLNLIGNSILIHLLQLMESGWTIVTNIIVLRLANVKEIDNRKFYYYSTKF